MKKRLKVAKAVEGGGGQTPKPAPRRRRRRRSGTIKALRGRIWATIDRLDSELESAEDVAELTKLSHAISQAAGVYLKVLEQGELSERLAAVEKAVNESE